MQLLDPGTKQLLGFVLLFLLVAPLFPFIYVVLRWRSQGAHEPGAGTFGALLYFRTAGLLLALAGAANLTYGWMSTTPATEELTRLSWGMLVGSAAFLIVNQALLFARFGPHPELLTARRVFTGFLMVMSGLVAFTALVLFCVTLFQKTADRQVEQRADELKLYGTWTGYYLVSYLSAVWLLSRGSRGAGP